MTECSRVVLWRCSQQYLTNIYTSVYLGSTISHLPLGIGASTRPERSCIVGSGGVAVVAFVVVLDVGSGFIGVSTGGLL